MVEWLFSSLLLFFYSLYREVEVFDEVSALCVFFVRRLEAHSDRDGADAGLLLDEEMIILRRDEYRDSSHATKSTGGLECRYFHSTCVCRSEPGQGLSMW